MKAQHRDPRITSKIMSAIPSKGTRPEIALRRALWRKKLRYRVNYKKLPGKPDIVFTKQKVVVFCDGDYWHGHNWALRGLPSLEDELAGYSEYWRKKILRNIERDDENNKALRTLGWTVLRIWESDIKKDLDACVNLIQETLLESKMINADTELSKQEIYMNKEERIMVDHFIEAVMTLKTVDECERFFTDICSSSELRKICRRFEIARLICEGNTYREIQNVTDASNLIISRVKRVLDNDDSMLRKTIQRFRDMD